MNLFSSGEDLKSQRRRLEDSEEGPYREKKGTGPNSK